MTDGHDRRAWISGPWAGPAISVRSVADRSGHPRRGSGNTGTVRPADVVQRGGESRSREGSSQAGRASNGTDTGGGKRSASIRGANRRSGTMAQPAQAVGAHYMSWSGGQYGDRALL